MFRMFLVRLLRCWRLNRLLIVLRMFGLDCGLRWRRGIVGGRNLVGGYDGEAD